MTILQCPACELKFRSGSELDDHLAVEHPSFRWKPKSVEDSLLAAAHRTPKGRAAYPPSYKPEPPPADGDHHRSDTER